VSDPAVRDECVIPHGGVGPILCASLNAGCMIRQTGLPYEEIDRHVYLSIKE